MMLLLLFSRTGQPPARDAHKHVPVILVSVRRIHYQPPSFRKEVRSMCRCVVKIVDSFIHGYRMAGRPTDWLTDWLNHSLTQSLENWLTRPEFQISNVGPSNFSFLAGIFFTIRTILKKLRGVWKCCNIYRFPEFKGIRLSMALDFQSSLGRKQFGCFQNCSGKAILESSWWCFLKVVLVARQIQNHHGY